MEPDATAALLADILKYGAGALSAMGTAVAAMGGAIWKFYGQANATLRDEKDRLATELAAVRQRHEEELATLRQRHEEECRGLRSDVRSRERVIDQLNGELVAWRTTAAMSGQNPPPTTATDLPRIDPDDDN